MLSDSYSNRQMNFSTSSKELIRGDLISELVVSFLFSNLILISWVAETTFPLSLYHRHYQSLLLCAQRHSIFVFNLLDYCLSLRPEIVCLFRGNRALMT